MSDRTEEASPKKKKDERKKGNVAKSKEVVNALTFSGIIILILTFSDTLLIELKNFVAMFLDSDYLLLNIDSLGSKQLISSATFTFFKLFLPIGFIIIILGIIGHVMQTGFLFIGEPLKPKLSKLNPINGFKNMFSARTLGVLVKDIAVLIVLVFVSYNFIIDNLSAILNTGNVYLPYLPQTVKYIVNKLLIQIFLCLIVIASLDFMYQLYTHKKQLRMTKEEIKEEYKQQEGDPQIKSRIKQKQRQIAQSRMMNAVPEATVVIVNPTHIAIALRYDETKDSAPVVVAKGADYTALRIKDIAKKYDVPIIENIPLARSLYPQAELDKEIPVDFYQAVSTILISIYQLKRKKMYKK